MGIILSRVRKKKSTVEKLEKLDNDIKEIEEYRVNAQRKYKKITKLLLIFTVVMYILCGLIFYFQFTSTLQGTLLYLVPVATSPLLLYIIKRIISWYFVRLLNKNQTRLNDMKKEKKKILEEVMDTETYKVAKEILEKFSEKPLPKPNPNLQLASVNGPIDGLRRRTIATVPNPPTPNRIPIVSKTPPPPSMISRPMPNRSFPGSPSPSFQLPAPVPPLQRSYLDKVVEYLIGDGPNNRYALICSRCHSHNGMALKEEFEYIGFKCCYCFTYNPARKIRPEAPKLEIPSRLNQESESDSEKTSGENSDTEHRKESDEKSADLANLISNVTNDGEPMGEEIKTNESIEGVSENASDTTVQPESISPKEIEVQNSKEEDRRSNQSEENGNCDESVTES